MRASGPPRPPFDPSSLNDEEYAAPKVILASGPCWAHGEHEHHPQGTEAWAGNPGAWPSLPALEHAQSSGSPAHTGSGAPPLTSCVHDRICVQAGLRDELERDLAGDVASICKQSHPVRAQCWVRAMSASRDTNIEFCIPDRQPRILTIYW